MNSSGVLRESIWCLSYFVLLKLWIVSDWSGNKASDSQSYNRPFSYLKCSLALIIPLSQQFSLTFRIFLFSVNTVKRQSLLHSLHVIILKSIFSQNIHWGRGKINFPRPQLSWQLELFVKNSSFAE